MVQFNQLLILPYTKGIYLDVQVMDMPFFENVYIDKIVIDTQDTFKLSGVSKTPVYTYTVEGNQKSLQKTISELELLVKTPLKCNLFFIYVFTKFDGVPSPDIPCGLDEPYTIATCADTYHIYRKGMDYIQETYDRCSVPKHFIDFILRYKAFEICLKTRDFTEAIKHWKLLNKKPRTINHSKCGCHG